jgi:hypothetical protein
VDAGLDDIQARVEQHQFNMAAQFDRRHRACKPRFRVGDWVRVRVKKHNKTDAAFSEPHQIVKMVAPFTVLIDNGSRWHMSKLKRVERPPEEPDMVPDDDDMEQASDQLPTTPGGTAAPANNDGGHGGQGHCAQPDVLRRSSRQRSVPTWHKDYHVQGRF